MSKRRLSRLESGVSALAKVLGYLSVVCLLFMMALTVFGVFMRYIMHRPILGANELIELASVGLVMLAIPYCTSERGHITVDVMDNKIGKIGRYAGDVIAALTGIVVLYFLAVRSWQKTTEAYEFEDVTNMIEAPIWPFFATVSIGAALYLLVLVVQLAQRIAGGLQDD
ncbi:MAG: TRAP-type C4-dicarboxylate transport system permease small subunit [Yoonia sp.]|jgi:TRAP-type C4-dicarboxylate transport system permease small subunit|tara:strand:+ start:762 stop:1268 length:507 start_codon:yes stop_codon:yes gene_type:complete